MSELHEIDGIIFGGEKYTVGKAGEVPEGLIDPMSVEYMPYVDSSGSFQWLSPVGIPVNMPDIDTGGNYITKLYDFYFTYYNVAKGWTGVKLPSHLEEVPNNTFKGGQLEFVEFGDHLTSIGSSAFQDNQITSVIIPDGVTSIGSQAFRNNQLTSVDFPDSITSIGTNAFNDNPLEEVSVSIDTDYLSTTFPSSAKINIRIPEGYAFGEGLTSIAEEAYRGRGLTGEITISDSVTRIGNSSLRENQITSVDLPDYLESIGKFAFDGNQLTSVVLPDSVTLIEEGAFRGNQLTSVVLPDSLTSIGSRAFQNNQITSVVLPDSLTSIGSSAFDGNPLEEVSIHIDTAYSNTTFPSGAVINYRIPEGYHFGEGQTSIGWSAFKGRGLTGAITIADSVTSIEDNAFQNNQITSVVIPDSVESIGMNTFRENQITSVNLPDSVTSIGSLAFYNNPLTEVSIGPNTTYDSTSFPSSAVITVRD